MPDNPSLWIRWSRRSRARLRPGLRSLGEATTVRNAPPELAAGSLTTEVTARPVGFTPPAPSLEPDGNVQRIALATAIVIALATTSRHVRADMPSLDGAFVLDFTGTGSATALLAAQLPADHQSDAHHILEQLLASYRAIEAKLGLTTNDPAAALAAFITGNLAAFHLTAVSDAGLLAIAEQLRGHPEVSKAFHADRPTVAEQLAILGTLMIVAQIGRNDPHRLDALSAAARRHLRRYLGCEAADLEITDHGLRWTRGTPTGPLAVLVRGPRIAVKPAHTVIVGRAAEAASKAATASAGAPPACTAAIATSASIETVAFYAVTRYGGYNGWITYAWDPIVLFKSGEAALGTTALSDPSADKLAHPNNWTRWRRTRHGYEYWGNESWNAVAWTTNAAPRHYKLDGRYVHESSTSHSGEDGVSSTSWRTLSFDRSGHFTLDGGGGAYGPRFAATARTTSVDGTYDISGYCLTLRHDDGQVEARSIVINHDKKMIWLDGIEYLRQ